MADPIIRGFEKEPTVRDRITRFLSDSKNLGIDWLSAASVAVASVNESGSLFFVERGEHGGYLPRDCFPYRQILALERGNPNLGDSPLPASWLGDPDVLKIMKNNGWLAGNGYQASADFAAPDLPSSPNNMMPHMIDWMLDQRKLKALEAFSIGATQMYLKWSPLTGGGLPSRFSTVESLWQFWTARTVKDLWDTGAWQYLTYGSPKLSETLMHCGAATDNTCVEMWLQTRQTGTVDWTAAGWSDYARRVATTNIPLVYSVGRAIGYV